MKYELNDKPGILPMLMYGLQWWIVSLPCVVIMGIIVSQLHYTDVAEQTFYLQKLFGIMGIAMIVQVLWGHRALFPPLKPPFFLKSVLFPSQYAFPYPFLPLWVLTASARKNCLKIRNDIAADG